MLIPADAGEPARSEVNEEEKTYSDLRTELVRLLKDKIAVLESSIADKDRIIALLEQQLHAHSGGHRPNDPSHPGPFQNPENPS